jgi:hypothetical protein
MTKRKSDIQLPNGMKAIGVSQEQAAISWGISPSQFAGLERDMIPRPRRAGNRKVYSVAELEQKFLELPFWDEDAVSDDDWQVGN